MSTTGLQVLTVVALLQDMPQQNLRRGAVGAIVERLSPDVVEVEFSDSGGRSYAMGPIPEENLLELLYERSEAAA